MSRARVSPTRRNDLVVSSLYNEARVSPSLNPSDKKRAREWSTTLAPLQCDRVDRPTARYELANDPLPLIDFA